MTEAADAIRRLADRPWTLFALFLAINALGRPCSITAHDARLYSLQALNQAERGAYADDVFLRYGSQDQFSLFSRVVGPMVAAVGLRLAFLLLYLVFNTLFVFAMFRLVRALIDDPLISTLALVFLVSAPLNYGGYDIFMVHEQFFTPRTIGTTLTLFALERLVRQQFATALFLVTAGALMHPLMAFGGALIWTGYVAYTFLPQRAFVGLFAAATIGGAAFLASPMAAGLFGTMDEDWHQTIRIAVGYNYPDSWLLKDWLNLGVSFALPIAASLSLYRDDPVRRRFLLIMTLAGIVGFLVTLAASLLPYALLFQGQPYRVLWILKVIQIPLGFLLIARWSQSAALWPKIAALALVAFFCIANYRMQELLIFGLALPISILVSRLTEQTDDAWWWYAIARGFVLGALGWMLFRWVFFLLQRKVIAQYFDFNELALFDLVSPVFWLVALCLTAARWSHASFNLGVIRWAPAAIAILTPLCLFAAEVSPAVQRDHTRLGSDIAFLREFVHEREASELRRPNIYCVLGRPDLLWIDVRATSYFDIIQTAGVMFNHRTADEIERRIGLVNKFEMARQRSEAMFLDEGRKVGMENLFKIPFDGPDPTEADVIRLCQEPGLDYVVITQEFPGLYPASNGRIFVYECYKVKTSSLSARVKAPGAMSQTLQRGR